MSMGSAQAHQTLISKRILRKSLCPARLKRVSQVYWELKELDDTGLLIDEHGQIINENTEKAGLLSKQFCFLFGKKPGDVFVSYEDDETLSTPTVTEEDVKQLLLMLDLLKPASSDILHPRILKDLAEEPSGLLMFTFNGFFGPQGDSQGLDQNKHVASVNRR